MTRPTATARIPSSAGMYPIGRLCHDGRLGCVRVRRDEGAGRRIRRAGGRSSWPRLSSPGRPGRPWSWSARLDDAPGADVVVVPSGRVVCVVVEVEGVASERTPCQSVPVTTSMPDPAATCSRRAPPASHRATQVGGGLLPGRVAHHRAAGPGAQLVGGHRGDEADAGQRGGGLGPLPGGAGAVAHGDLHALRGQLAGPAAEQGEHGVGLGPLDQAEDRRLAHGVGGALERVGREAVGVERAEAGAEVEDVVGGQLAVDRDARQAHVDELVERARIPRPVVDGPAEGSPDEVLLAGDAPDVGPQVLDPAAVDLLLVVPRPHVGERLHRDRGCGNRPRGGRGRSPRHGPGTGWAPGRRRSPRRGHGTTRSRPGRSG